MTKLEQARKLLAERSGPGGWAHWSGSRKDIAEAGFCIADCGTDADGVDHIVSLYHDGMPDSRPEIDADLLVAAVNQYAALLDVVEQVQWNMGNGQTQCAICGGWNGVHRSGCAVAKWEELA